MKNEKLIEVLLNSKETIQGFLAADAYEARSNQQAIQNMDSLLWKLGYRKPREVATPIKIIFPVRDLEPNRITNFPSLPSENPLAIKDISEKTRTLTPKLKRTTPEMKIEILRLFNEEKNSIEEVSDIMHVLKESVLTILGLNETDNALVIASSEGGSGLDKLKKEVKKRQNS